MGTDCDWCLSANTESVRKVFGDNSKIILRLSPFYETFQDISLKIFAKFFILGPDHFLRCTVCYLNEAIS